MELHNLALTQDQVTSGQNGSVILSQALSLPDRLDLHEQLMAARLDALRTINKALKPLYASFDDAQTWTADQLFWGPMGMMGMSTT